MLTARDEVARKDAPTGRGGEGGGVAGRGGAGRGEKIRRRQGVNKEE